MGGYKKLVSNTLIMTIGQFSNKILAFLLVPLYTAILSTEDYGTYDIIVTTSTLLTPILTIVISEAVMRFCLDKGYDSREVLSVGLVIASLGTLVLASLYPVFLYIDALREYFWWLLLYFFLTNVDGVLSQYLKGCEKIKTYTLCGVAATLLNLSLNILFLVVFRWGIVGYIFATCLVCGAKMIIILVSQRIWNKIVNPFRIKRSVYHSMIRYTAPMIPNSVSWWISNSSDKYMILAFMSTGAVGIYSVAYKIPTILTMFTSIFISALQISSVEDFGSESSKRFMSNVYKTFNCGSVIAASFIVLLAYPVGLFLFQNEFFEAWKVSTILVVAYVFNALSAFVGTIYTASKKTKFLFYSTLIAAGSNIVMNFLLIPWIGIYGAAIATFASYALVWLARIIHSRSILPLKINFVADAASYLLLLIEVALVIYFDTLFCAWALIPVVGIIAINIMPLIRSGIFSRVMNKLLKRKKT